MKSSVLASRSFYNCTPKTLSIDNKSRKMSVEYQTDADYFRCSEAGVLILGPVSYSKRIPCFERKGKMRKRKRLGLIIY
jgi:hypothetical protein